MTFEEKIAKIKKKFAALSSPDERYHLLMEMGRQLPPFPPEFKTADRRVDGCQSILYLSAELKEGKLFFSAYSDALISSGLASLLITIYSEEPPKTLLTHPPDFLSELGIVASLSPNRSNGFFHLHRRMVREALKYLR